MYLKKISKYDLQYYNQKVNFKYNLINLDLYEMHFDLIFPLLIKIILAHKQYNNDKIITELFKVKSKCDQAAIFKAVFIVSLVPNPDLYNIHSS